MDAIKLPKYFIFSGKYIRESVKTIVKLNKSEDKELAIDFSSVERINKGDLLVLLAQIEKSRVTNKNKIFRVGAMPKDRTVKAVLFSKDTYFHETKEIKTTDFDISEKASLINPNLIDSIVKDLKKIGFKEYYHHNGKKIHQSVNWIKAYLSEAFTSLFVFH